MTDIKELLGDVAEQAKVYDVSKPVIRVARRQARTRWLAPVAAAAAVVLAAAGGWAVWPRADAPDRPAAAAATTPPPWMITSLDWLPAEARPPSEIPPVLPADRPVGPAALAYASCARGGCYAYLLLSDGTYYRLTERRQPVADTVSSVSLSPDGRWLGQLVNGTYMLRDLTGTRTYPFPGCERAVGWSANGEWAMIRRARDMGSTRVLLKVVNLNDGRAFDTELHSMDPRFSLLNSGEIVHADRLTSSREAPRGPRSTRVEVSAKNPQTGKTRVLVDVDIAGSLREDERISPEMSPELTQDGTAVLMRVMEMEDLGGGSSVGRYGDVLKVTPDGKVTRYPLPKEGQSLNGQWTGETWGLVGQYGKDLLVVHLDGRNPELQALDTRTGKLRTVCALPDGLTELVIPRGW